MSHPVYTYNYPQQQPYYPQSYPGLKILEQPTANFRYRYKSEDGTHGSIQGEKSTKANKTYPEVQLQNYNGRGGVTIKASLCLDDCEQFHVHELTGDREVFAGPETRFVAKFQNLRINQTQKKEAREKLIQRIKANPGNILIQDEDRIGKVADEQLKKINLNVAILKFEAIGDEGQLMCEPVYSHRIHNGKSAQFTRLQICRMDKVEGCCVGGDEVFLLCEKVQKGNIQIKFSETINGKEVWCDYGKFNDCDIHHQYAIVFKTPKYKDAILHDVKVSVRLVRKKDRASSDEVTFTYTPVDDGGMEKKRRKTIKQSDEDYNRHQYLVDDFRQHQHWNPDSMNQGNGYTFQYNDSMGSRGSGDSSQESQSSSDFTTLDPESVTNVIVGKDKLLSSTGSNDNDERKGPKSDGSSTDTEETAKPLAKAQAQSGRSSGKEPLSRTTSLPVLPSFAEAAYRLTVRSARTLHDFAQTGDVRILLMGMRHLIAVQDEQGDNVVHASIIHAQTETLTPLVEVARTIPDFDILNMWNVLHQTPLHLAVHTERPEVVRLLLSHGANPNIPDRKGNTAIHLAAGLKAPHCLLALLDPKSYTKKYSKNRPKLNCPNYSGRTPIHMAAVCNNVESVNVLWRSGANVNYADGTSGRTALHVSVENRCVDIMRLLLEDAKADVDARMFNGNTALHLASSIGNVDCVQLLMNHGADPMAENLESVRVTDVAGDDSEDEGEDAESTGSSWERIGQTPVDMASTLEIRSILNGEKPVITTKTVKESSETKPANEDSGMCLSSARSSKPSITEKPQPAKPTTAVGDSGLGISSKSELDALDLKTKTRLAEMLDPPSKDWMKLAKKLHLTSFMHILKEETSPTFAMFEYIDNLKELRTALGELDFTEALDIIEASCPIEEEWLEKSSGKREDTSIAEGLSKLHL